LSDTFTLNFGVNLLLIFVINGLIFSYYLFEIRRVNESSSMKKYIYICLFLIFVSISTLLTTLYIKSDLKEKESMTKSRLQTNTYDSDYPNRIRPDQSPGVIISSATTGLPSAPQTISGIDFVISSAQITQDQFGFVLELDLIFEANTPCPHTGGAVCGVNRLGVKATDGEGFKLTRIKLDDVESLKETILDLGEKVRGKYYFRVLESTGTYYITYNSGSGESTEKIEIVMKTE
jgi:hypothetical protein